MATALPAQILPASEIADDTVAATALAPRPSLMRRLFEAIVESQTKRAEREIARVLGPDGLAQLRANMLQR